MSSELREVLLKQREAFIQKFGRAPGLTEPVFFDPNDGEHAWRAAKEVAIWLVENRDIWGLGVDTISFDPGFDNDYRAHKAIGARDRWALEALANLDAVPPVGGTLIVGAANVRGATGGLVRPIAVWDSNSAVPLANALIGR